MIVIFIVLLALLIAILIGVILEDEKFIKGFNIGAFFVAIGVLTVCVGLQLYEDSLHKDYRYSIEEVSEIAIDTTYIVNKVSTDTIFTLHYNKTNK